jgi:hypothetical protein
VGFVDREQAQGALLVQVIEQAQKARRVQPLGRDIQQRDGAGLQAQLHVLGLASQSSVEFRKAAGTPASSSAPTWSCISAISGDTTMATPWPARWRAMAGTW